MKLKLAIVLGLLSAAFSAHASIPMEISAAAMRVQTAQASKDKADLPAAWQNWAQVVLNYAQSQADIKTKKEYYTLIVATLGVLDKAQPTLLTAQTKTIIQQAQQNLR